MFRVRGTNIVGASVQRQDQFCIEVDAKDAIEAVRLARVIQEVGWGAALISCHMIAVRDLCCKRSDPRVTLDPEEHGMRLRRIARMPAGEKERVALVQLVEWARAERKMSQNALAKELGVNRGSFSTYVVGSKSLTVPVAGRICVYLEREAPEQEDLRKPFLDFVQMNERSD